MAPLVKPARLRPGDAVRVVAPAGPFDRPTFDRGLAVLAAQYRVSFDEGIFAQERYLAGPDARREKELTDALSAPDVRAVFAARGGYGAMRLLPRLGLRGVAPKLLVGFSDITALHLALQAQGWSSVHGPVLTQLGRASEAVAARLFDVLESSQAPGPLRGTECLVQGTAEGPLVGGNLSVLTRLLGTPYLPSLRGAVLFLEDVGERPYRLDRMWTHLRLAGVFSEIAGLALGTFTGCDEPDGGLRAVEVLRTLAAETGLPCSLGFPVGHQDENFAIPLGTRARLDADSSTLTFLEPVTADEGRV